MNVKDPAESVVVTFDFSSELASVGGAVVSVLVLGDGVDPDVGAMADGALQISGATVLQRISSGIHGLDYKLRCVATTGSDVIVRADTLPVRTA